MKRCPTCQRAYADETLSFCRADGTQLINDVTYSEDSPTRLINLPARGDALQTEILRDTAPEQTPRTGVTADLRPETRYAKSGDINIAYQVLGDGPVDLVYVPGWVTHLEYGWEEPSLARFYRRLASFSRLILFDKRGTGLSDQTTDLPTLEQRMDDVRAVMEAVDSERAVVFGMSEGGNMALLFAATYPERTVALITFGVFASRVWSPDYPWGPTPDERQKFYDAIKHEWGGPIGVEDLAPSMAHDERFRQWWASYQRRSASPRAALALAQMNTMIDVRHVLPAIRVPTLVLHRMGDLDSNIEEGRYIAAHIPGAKFVELPGEDHLLFVGDQDAVLHEVENFIRSTRHLQDSDSVLATVLAVVPAPGADEEKTGQRQELLKRLHTLAKREAEWFNGRTHEAQAGDFLATFDGPVRAIRCACAIRDAARRLGAEVRTGLHTGLCDVQGDEVSGTAVELSRRVAAESAAGEVLASNTVKDLVSGSGIAFSDRGSLTSEAHGVWRLFSVI